jgi:protein-S-isoprenylcysteine O-methyltransferase Ste14
MITLKELSSAPPQTRRNAFRRVGQMLFFDALITLLLFACAGRLDWAYAWVYSVAMILIQLIGAFFMPLEVLAERGSRKENPEKWDRVVIGLLLVCFLGMYVVAGLDFRWHWSVDLAAAWHLGAVLLFLLGCALEMWAIRENSFFSTVVRIQSERGHAVCSTGPYRYIRHPGYASMILYYGVTPILLGALWALVPTLLVVLLFVLRTWLEDNTLQKKLPGYDKYAVRVRFRLLPGLW